MRTLTHLCASLVLFLLFLSCARSITAQETSSVSIQKSAELIQASSAPFGWACSATATTGDDYQLTGGGNGTSITLTSTGEDMRKEITNAIKKYNVVILDGSKGDFLVSSYMTLAHLRDKTIVGINGARLCTQFYITPEIRQVLIDAGALEASTSGGTGGVLQMGEKSEKISEQCEFICRSTLYEKVGNEDYRESGIFRINDCENIILRNLKLVGPGSIDVGGSDVVSVVGATKHLWIDHCDFTDGMDGNLDITQGSDFITVSWCTFSYTERAFIHQNTNLIGHSDNWTSDEGTLHVTYAYNVWGQGCRARMPMVRYGTVHLLNNYYNCAGNLTACINPRKNSTVFVEGNYFERGVTRVFTAKDARAWKWDDSNVVNEKFSHPGNQGEISIPYKYNKVKADLLPEMLKGAGASLKGI